MPELRWILLGAGLVLIVLVYFISRRSAASSEDTTVVRQEPSLGDAAGTAEAVTEDVRREPQIADSADVLLSDPETIDSRPEKKRAPNLERPAHEQKIVTLRVAARGSERFGGKELVDVLRGEGLEHGQFDIFHRHVNDDADSDAVFSVASMVEPGHFDLDNLADLSTPGISLFMLLPGPKDGIEAFTDMLSTARELADRLEGDVLDEVGSTLSRQAESHVREEIVNYQHRLATLRST